MLSRIALLILMAVGLSAQPAGQSPASQRPPATTNAQSYTASEIETGQARFVSQCGFCHGRDAEGGETGPDLTRSMLVAEDLRGDKLGPFIASGRPEKGMPAFALSAGEIAPLVAFIHDAKSQAESDRGGRRSVDIGDLQTGNADSGKSYFNGAGGCSNCHSLNGSFATIGSRFEGLALLQRMLYPGRGGPTATFRPSVTITTADGRKFTGKVAYRDEFTITVIDPDGWSRSWPMSAAKIEVDDSMRAHTELLGRYSDEEIHDVFAYLQTLK